MSNLTAPSNLKEITRFNISIDQVEEVNPLFSKCFIKILYTGLNQNKVYIEREVAEEMAKTLYNIPIVGEYLEKVDDFKDHGGRIEIEDDSIEFVHTTKPYGVVPANTNITWMSVTEEDGTVRDYLTCWGYLWTGRYPEVKRVIEQGNPQSLELDEDTLEGQWVKEGPQVYFKISKAVFSALAILGEKVPPAFESASIGAYYTLNPIAFSKQFNKMMRELKESLGEEEVKQVVNFSKDEDDNSSDSNKGGKIMSDTKNQVVLAFELNDIRAKLYDKVQPKDEDGKMEWRFSIHDVQEDKVILYDHSENKHFRQFYTTSDDDVTLGEQQEVVIKDFADGEQPEELEQMKTRLEELEIKLTQAQDKVVALEQDKETYAADKEELESLRSFKQDVEKKEKEEVITKFAAILADEDLQECRDKIDEFTKDEIESKLSVVAVRKNVSFTKQDDDDDVDLIPEVDNDDGTPGWVKIIKEHQVQE